MAPGAQQGDVVREVLKQGLTLIGGGIVISVLAGLGLTRFLASQLWGVSPIDSWTFIVVICGTTAVGAASCFLPSRRASQVDPLITLRCE
jgi:putative ABC transport system permease protein